MVDFIPGMALIHLTRGTDSLGSRGPQRATDGRRSGQANDRWARAPRGGKGAGVREARPTTSADDGRGADPVVSDAAVHPDSGPESGAQADPVTCGFCGKSFVEDRSQATCQACPLSRGCGLMRCPHCGYENAKEPGWLSRIKEWIG